MLSTKAAASTPALSGKAIFLRDVDHFVPTRQSVGPWHPEMLHGGAPAGLIAWAVEQARAPGLAVLRFTMDLLKPVFRAPLQLETRVLRQGKRMQILDITLSNAVEPLCVARVVLGENRVDPQAALHSAQGLPAWPFNGPEAYERSDFGYMRAMSGFQLEQGLHTEVEYRPVEGCRGEGLGHAWFRLPLSVVQGETNTPLMNIALLADLANGIGQQLLPGSSAGDTRGMINLDLDLHLLREPQGEWIGMQAATLRADGSDSALLDNLLFDQQGYLGRSVQSLLPQGVGSA